jgi:hypothetical protein
MARQGGRLTAQEQQFIRLVVEEGHSFVAAYRIAYPSRNGARSAGAERVAAKVVAHRPLVAQRMDQLREELLASDPVEMRRRANAVLGQILAKRLDPKYRRTALDTLRLLNEQERAADRESFRALKAGLGALDALEGKTTKRTRSNATPPPAKERPPVDIDKVIEEIDEIVKEQQGGRNPELPPLSVPDLCLDVPPQAAEETVQAKPAAVQAASPAAGGVGLVRRPGHFGQASWVRRPDPH